ncbi:AtpZ/AtpI family protein [Leptobacterium sp. I13]|uniref:AtpZ/AtpI family protein n=1 Tax=Leptobacterium meishanense TaxID=3128904 RepID=UPI0030EC4B18
MSGQKPKKPYNKFLILTGVALQMGLTIYLMAYLGKWLDENYNAGNKRYIIIFTLLGVGIALFNVVRQTNKLNK